jgi:dihydroorotase
VILIKNGTLIDPANGLEGEFDLVIDGRRIADVQKRGQISQGSFSEVIDASSKWVLPGLIDLHVHLREPGAEWKETIKTGAEAAIMGGFTAICAMPNTSPRNDSAEVTRFILEKARAAQAARVLPIGAVSIGLEGKQLTPIPELLEAGCVAFSDDGEPVYDSGLMKKALEWCAMSGATISCHEEDKCLSCSGVMNESPLSFSLGLRGMPTVAEDVMVARDIELSRATGGKVHICHISSARSVELVRRAKNDGIAVTAEVTPHHLTLDESNVASYDANSKMSPPLRSAAEIEGLLEGLKDGTIDAVASDHAPHEKDSKLVEFSRATFGILGLQTSLSLIIDLIDSRALSRKRAIESLTSAPARIFGLELGSLKRGAPADVIVVDPQRQWVFDSSSVRSLSFNSPFLGRQLKGMVEVVFVNGDLKLQNGKLINE